MSLITVLALARMCVMGTMAKDNDVGCSNYRYVRCGMQHTHTL